MTAFPATDYLVAGIFAVCVAATVAGALIAVATARVIRSVCGLALCCIGLAGLFYFLHSPFLALMEVLIYVGAICVTIVFAIMLAEPEEAIPAHRRPSDILGVLGALVVSGCVFWGVSRLAFVQLASPAAAKVGDGSLRAIGIALLTTYSLVFELISLVLLGAILGALAIARLGRAKP